MGFSFVRAIARQERGQTVVETILVLPMFLIFVFGLLQVGQLAVTLVTVNYAAGSIARKAVQRDSTQPTQADKVQLEQLMFGGMTAVGPVFPATSGSNSVTPDLQVNACASVDAFPVIGPFLNSALGSALAAGANCDDSAGPFHFGPVGTGRYAFVVKGTAKARMNYVPR